jgi:hypothetical protein
MAPERSRGAAFGGSLSALRRGVERRVHGADLGERDPDYIRDNLPWRWLLAPVWFRAEVCGLANIPDRGPALLVANHAGGNVAPDTAQVLPAIDLHERFGRNPDVDEVYEHVISLMQQTLDELAARRRLPVLG